MADLGSALSGGYGYAPAPANQANSPAMQHALAPPTALDAMINSITSALLGWTNTPEAPPTAPPHGYPTPNNQKGWDALQQQMEQNQQDRNQMMQTAPMKATPQKADPFFTPPQMTLDEPFTSIDDPVDFAPPPAISPNDPFSNINADPSLAQNSPLGQLATGYTAVNQADDTSVAPSFGFGVLGSTATDPGINTAADADAALSGAPAPGQTGYGTVAEAVSPTMGFADAEAAATNEAAANLGDSDPGALGGLGEGDGDGEGGGEGGDGGDD